MDDFAAFEAELAAIPSRRRAGRVVSADAGAVAVAGLGPTARVGDRVSVRDALGGEIVALGGGVARAMTYGPAEGVGLDDIVWLEREEGPRVSEAWIGRVVDAFGRPLDGRPLPAGAPPAPLRRAPPEAAARGRLGGRLDTGLSVFDAMLPIARGQRIGVFAGSGVGKSTLLADLARGVEADAVVFALIGERGRELKDFAERGLGATGMARAVVVAADAAQPPLVKRRAAWTAMAAAERLRDQGRHVLLLVDSVTRFAEAHREIALTAGETPSLRAYPPSTANMIAALAERAGPGAADSGGAITAIFSVLVAGSDMEEPVADIARGVLDGHVVLERAIAERGRFPAVDVRRSVSRSLPGVAADEENALIAEARRLIGAYERAEPMLQTGLYQAGADAEIDRAVALHPALDAFFAAKAPEGAADSFARLRAVLRSGDGTQATGRKVRAAS